MPDPYERLPEDDEAPEALLDDAAAYMTVAVPGWQRDDAALETALMAAFSDEGSTLYSLLREEADDRYADFGEEILGVPPGDPVAAVAVTTWTAVDDTGHTIDQGQTLVIGGYGFEVLEQTSIPNGSTSVTDVEVRALDAGTAPNGVEEPVEFDEFPAWVESVVVTSPAEDGSDGDTAEEHIAEVRGEASLLSRAPIQAEDYETVAQKEPEIARALVRDNYIPGTNEVEQVVIDATSGNWTFEPFDAGQTASGLAWDITAEDFQTAIEGLPNILPGDVIVTGGPGATAPLIVEWTGQYAGTNVTTSVTTDTLSGGAGTATVSTVTSGVAPQEDQDLYVSVFPVDIDGQPVSTDTKTSLAARYAERTIINTVVPIRDPTYTVVDVTIDVVAEEGVGHDELEARVAEQIASVSLNPALFGLPPVGERRTWRFKDTIRQYEVARDAMIDGVLYIDGPVLLSRDDNAPVDADLVLSGAAPLPTPGTITVNVS